MHTVNKGILNSLVCHRRRGWAYMASKNYAGEALARTIKNIEKKLTKECDAVLDTSLDDFDRVCPDGDDKI
jgi:hypothetical protein